MRWALVKVEQGDDTIRKPTVYDYSEKALSQAEQRAAALLAVARAAVSIEDWWLNGLRDGGSSSAADISKALDALRAVMPEFDKE